MTMRSLCVVATAAAATSAPAASISLRPLSIPPPPRRILAVAGDAHRSRGLRCHNVSSRKQLYIARGTAKIVMGIRAVESYDASFQLQAESDQLLRSLLSSDSFCNQVAKESGLVDAGATTEFSGLLFQPVPWSPTTKHGMPQEFEIYLHDKDNFVIVNVPPNFMFQAKWAIITMGNLVLLGRYLSLQGCAQSSKSHQALESSRLQQFQVHKDA